MPPRVSGGSAASSHLCTALVVEELFANGVARVVYSRGTAETQGDWERLLAEDYSRPPAVSDAANMDDTLELGELVEPLGFDSIWATEH